MSNLPSKLLTTPVTLIIFNRPQYTKETFDAIREARPETLFLIADGGRNEEEWVLCHEARKIAESVDWPCTVHKDFSDINLGVRKRIESGITKVLEKVDQTIILEDDCIPDPSFFTFCQEMLEKYKDNEEVMMISGDNPLEPKIEIFNDNSYIFSKYFAIWGWATWSRAWQKYDGPMKDWPLRKNKRKIFTELGHRGAAEYLTELFDKAYTGKINSWATRWFYTCLFSGGLSIVPRNNLVTNIGVEGIHSSPGRNNNVLRTRMDTDHIVHPAFVSWNKQYDSLFFDTNFPWSPFPSPKRLTIIVLVSVKHLLQKLPLLGKIIDNADIFNFHTLSYIKRKIEYKLTKKITLWPINIHKNAVKGRVLLSYICLPFLRQKDKSNINHTNEWECVEIAKIFLERGFAVDVIEWNNEIFIPKHPYDIIIDIHGNIERLTPLLPSTCTKVFHVTGAHFKFMNEAEERRLRELKARRGIILPPKRKVPTSRNIECSDCATSLGNEFTWHTYDFAKKPFYPIPISTPIVFDFPKDRNILEAKKHFIWFGGTGFIHKGLDLVLEAFVQMPEFHLTVIGPIQKEKEFEEAFKKELYETSNIKTVGWLSIDSKEFEEITRDTIAIVYPSCAEGGGGSVISCMHRGLIPIVTYESSVTVLDFGIILKQATIKEIMETVIKIAAESDEELFMRTQKTWEYARSHHTKEKFSASFRKFADMIITSKITQHE